MLGSTEQLALPEVPVTAGARPRQPLKDRIYHYLLQQGPRGATDHQLAEALGCTGIRLQQLRTRRFALKRAGYLLDSGLRRENHKRRRCIVWVAAGRPLDGESGPAWVRCGNCDDFFCRIHDCHVADCFCPGIEKWHVNPYYEGGSPL